MNKFIIIYIILFLIISQNQICQSKLPKKQCKQWKELNKTIEENKEFQNKQDRLMLGTMYDKYCSNHPQEPLLEQIEGNDCMVIQKIFKDILSRDVLINVQKHHQRKKNLKFRYQLVEYLHSICTTDNNNNKNNNNNNV